MDRVGNKLGQQWVRKLIGKPVDITPPDCEFDARRIHIRIDFMKYAYHFWPQRATQCVSSRICWPAFATWSNIQAHSRTELQPEKL